MSRYTYAGEYQNPTTGFYVKLVGERFEIWVRADRAKDGSAPADRKHTSAPTFDEPSDADEYIADLAQFYEDDYDDYLEENHDSIVQMERYEAFLNER